MGPIWTLLPYDDARAVIPKERSEFNWLEVQDIMTAIYLYIFVILNIVIGREMI